jgi:hypothetical protein
MKLILLLFFVPTVFGFAEAPKKDPLSKYARLWTNSLVTVPPPPQEQEKVEVTTPLDDYVLGGYTKMQSGYFVSLINTTDPKKRITIAPGAPGAADYSVLQVRKNPQNYADVQVLIKVGDQQKWLGYDEKYLTISRPAAAEATPNQPPVPAAAANGNRNNNRNNNNNSRERQPRVRRVPLPPNSNN